MKSDKVKDALPKMPKHLFWDYNFEDLSLTEDREVIIRKVLSHGSINDLKWLRNVIEDEEIRTFLMNTRGRGIDRRRIRFYQVIFGLPAREVDLWLKDPARKVWDERCKR